MAKGNDDRHDMVAAMLAEAGIADAPDRVAPIGGGCMHEALRVDAGGRALFVKHDTPARAGLFAAESEALAAMAATRTVRVPEPLGTGVAAGHAFLITEFIELGGDGDPAAFGAELARMHATTAEAFGWHRDNWIGTTDQPNGWLADWAAFWRDRRLGPQLALAESDGRPRLAERGRVLTEHLAELLGDHDPSPSLLHGDLWAGNYAFDAAGRGCLFDPASYYGDREADLAMTELFGGFPRAFYEGYRAAWPLPPGYETRRELYNLYHVLNHAHLFGGGYARSAERMIDGLLASVRG